MPAINCDDCKDRKCPQRIVGALCSRNKETEQLIKMYESRDPVLISRNLVGILGVEMDRYRKAVAQEKIGSTKIKKVVSRTGEVIELEVEAEPNPAVTDMAKGLIRSGKIINDIVNPPKIAPLIQNNTQYNFGSGVANEIMALSDEEKQAQIKYIDDRLNA